LVPSQDPTVLFAFFLPVKPFRRQSWQRAGYFAQGLGGIFITFLLTSLSTFSLEVSMMQLSVVFIALMIA